MMVILSVIIFNATYFPEIIYIFIDVDFISRDRMATARNHLSWPCFTYLTPYFTRWLAVDTVQIQFCQFDDERFTNEHNESLILIRNADSIWLRETNRLLSSHIADGSLFLSLLYNWLHRMALLHACKFDTAFNLCHRKPLLLINGKLF